MVVAKLSYCWETWRSLSQDTWMTRSCSIVAFCSSSFFTPWTRFLDEEARSTCAGVFAGSYISGTYYISGEDGSWGVSLSYSVSSSEELSLSTGRLLSWVRLGRWLMRRST